MRFIGFALFVLLLIPSGGSIAAEKIKIGTLLTTGSGPLYVAKERGYFAAEGLDVDFAYFDAGQPVAVAAVSGDIDFGMAGVTSALYTLAQQGQLRLIGGWAYEAPSFHSSAVVVSNGAFDGGLKSFKDLAGHSAALTQIGSSYQYALALIAQKYGVDMASMRMVPMQSMSNIASAIAGNQADSAVLIVNAALPIVTHGNAKLLGWVGDETPWQVAAIWISSKTADDRRDTVVHFLQAVRKGVADFNAAFIDKNGQRRDGDGAAPMYDLIGKYVHLPLDQMKISVGYVDPQLRLDVKDVERQIAWYQSQGMIKGDVDINRVVDTRYAVPMSGK